MLKKIVLLCSMGLFTGVAMCQEQKVQRLKVFLDCSSTWCDFDYIRTEINVVDFLLDRVAADVHVLVTSQRNGSGALQYQLIFYGQNKFRGTSDTLRVNTDPNATDFERRGHLAHYLKLGLIPFVSKTGQGGAISIVMKTSADSSKTPLVTHDPWNYWVFRIGANGSVQADQVYNTTSLGAYFTANRTTNDVKVNFSVYDEENYSSSYYETGDDTVNTYVQNREYGISHSLIKSINQHWSYGYETKYSSNSFRNNKSRATLEGAIEYNFFPYKDVNTKLLTLSYGLNVRHNRYFETTIFEKTEEMLWSHNLRLSVGFNQKWGNIATGFGYRSYLKDRALNNFSANVETEVRVTGGLSFYIYLFGGIIHDQVYLPAEGATKDEVLTRRRALASSYNFQSWVGLNYRFGSKLNNFVNRRFDGQANDIDFE